MSMALMLCAVQSSASGAESTGVRIYKALYAVDVEEVEQAQKDGVSRLALTLQKKVVVMMEKSDVPQGLGKMRTYMVARDAGFNVQAGRPVAKPVPTYLLDPEWAPTQARSVSEAVISTANGSDAGDKPTWNALILTGCPTNPNRYQGVVVAGESITAMLWITNKLPANPISGANAPVNEEIAAMNEALVKAKADMEPIKPVKSQVGAGDERIQEFVKAAADAEDLKDFKPMLLIMTKEEPLMAFQNRNADTLKLTKLANGKIQVLQTSISN